METLDFSCSSCKREEVDGKALASDKTVLSLLVSLFLFPSLFLSLSLSISFSSVFSFSFPPRLPIVSSFFRHVLLSPLLPRNAAHFCRAFKYCARKFDPLSKVQRLTAAEGRTPSRWRE